MAENEKGRGIGTGMREKHEAYWYHVTFNAMHNLVLDNPKSMHAHTFRVGLYVTEKQDDHPVFLNNERLLTDYFERYRGIRLNEIHPFVETLPTLENMAEIFYEELKPIFAGNGMHLVSLEIGDSPISTYCVGERLLLGEVFGLVKTEEMTAYCERVRERYRSLGENAND